MPMLVGLFVLLLIVSTGCVHRIQVNPLPSDPASTTISRSLQIAVGPLAIEGADHRPGIALLEWPHHDLRKAIIQYVEQRGTFGPVFSDNADLTLHISTKLALASRQGLYHYKILLQAEMREADRLVRSYRSEHTAPGSSVRWVTASDRDPIESALQSALDDLLAQIEADRPFYDGDSTNQPVS